MRGGALFSPACCRTNGEYHRIRHVPISLCLTFCPCCSRTTAAAPARSTPAGSAVPKLPALLQQSAVQVQATGGKVNNKGGYVLEVVCNKMARTTVDPMRYANKSFGGERLKQEYVNYIETMKAQRPDEYLELYDSTFQRLRSEQGFSQKQAGEILNISQPRVCQRLAEISAKSQCKPPQPGKGGRPPVLSDLPEVDAEGNKTPSILATVRQLIYWSQTRVPWPLRPPRRPLRQPPVPPLGLKM